MNSGLKILVIRFSSFGDIILSFPLLKKIREKFPSGEINFITGEEYGELLKLNPNIDNIILAGDEPLKEIRRRLDDMKFDLVLDIHKNFKSLSVTKNYGNRVRRYFKNNFKKFLLVSLKKNLFKEIVPVYRKYLLTIRDKLNDNDYDFTVTDLKFDKEARYEDPYIVISPSAKHFTKTYPKEKFTGFINSYPGKKFILVGSSSERDTEICKYIEENTENILNLCGKLNYNELANVIYNSEYVICNDSGILHFAEALGKKVIALFGSTVKEFGFFPQLMKSRVIENNELSCRPCTHIGRSACPLNHFLCMNELKIDIQ